MVDDRLLGPQNPLHGTLLLNIDSDALVPFSILALDRRAFNNMILSSEDGVHLLKTHLLGLWDKEPREGCKQKVDSSKHVKGVKSFVLQEDGEKLLDNRVDDVLCLGAHAYGLGTHIHGKDLRSEDPDCSAP